MGKGSGYPQGQERRGKGAACPVGGCPMKPSFDVIGAAARNYSKATAAVQILSPIRQHAADRADAIRENLERVKEIGGKVRFVRSLHWVPGFFPTPPALVARMIEAANVSPGLCCLEPSAGTGNLVRAIYAAGCTCHAVEIVPKMADALRTQGYNVQNRDFLTMEPGPHFFARVLMNPPYENRQDESHTRHAFRFLERGGLLVSLVSSPTGQRLQQWAESTGGHVEQLGAGHFLKAERST